jgi:hypothetical protein
MKRFKHNLSHYKLFSANMGNIIPCGFTEVIPGDTVQHHTSALVRLSPLLAPVMHPLHVKIHHWFIPYRLIWEDFESFITGGSDGNDASVYPTIDMGGSGASEGSLADYLGVTPGVADLVVSALPFRAYNLVWNEWYRDQDLQTEQTIDVTSGADTTTDVDLLNACWEKDYFTSSRPWEQKGDSVTLPLGTEAPITGLGWSAQTEVTGPITSYTTGGIDASFAKYQNSGSNSLFTEADPDNPGYPNIKADLSDATAASVNDIREAFALQRYKEARARWGSRYTEYLAYLGIRPSDARLQRPEYLGGGKQTIQFSEVLQTAEGTDPVGQLRGHGIGAMRSNKYRRFFEEHGAVLSTLTVRPKAMYADGIARHFNRRTKEDFYQKELQHIGQQEILNKEVYAGHTTPDGVFGYQDRYDEYKRNRSTIAGEFRSSTLDYWHMARLFSSDPALNSDFVECVPTERIFADNSSDTLYIMANHRMVARRMVAKSGASFIY